MDGAALVGAVRTDVVHDLRAVLVGDLVSHTVKVHLEVELVVHVRVYGVHVIGDVGAVGVVVVAAIVVGITRGGVDAGLLEKLLLALG